MNLRIKDDQHFKTAFGEMDSMRKKGLECDVTLMAKDKKIRPHKIVLRSCSEFFNSISSETRKDGINLKQIKGEILLVLIDYIYTSEIEINITNVEDLLLGANVLQLKHLISECCRYLESNLNINTSLKIFLIAQNSNFTDLLKKTKTFINENMNEIMNTEEFLNLSIDEITRFISKKTLEVRSEEKIFEGIMSWIERDLTSRKQHLSLLMAHVQFILISRDYIRKHVIDNPLIEEDLKCNRLIRKALAKKNDSDMNPIKKRKREEPSQVLLIMGGCNEEAEGTFEFYDLKTNRRSQIYTLPSNIEECSLAVVNGKIYVAGLDYIKEYDLANNCWSNSIDMKRPKSFYGVGILNNCIYVYDVKFDISNQKWSPIAPMSTKRMEPSVGALNGLLYAVGDCNLSTLKLVEFYDPNLNVWKRCSDLITGRLGAAIGILHNKMYVIGGMNENGFLNSVECYSPKSNKFTQSASLNFPRYASTALEFNDKLYVIGGYNESGPLDTIEVYCPKINKWELLPITMNVARYAHGAVIVEKIIDF